MCLYNTSIFIFNQMPQIFCILFFVKKKQSISSKQKVLINIFYKCLAQSQKYGGSARGYLKVFCIMFIYVWCKVYATSLDNPCLSYDICIMFKFFFIRWTCWNGISVIGSVQFFTSFREPGPLNRVTYCYKNTWLLYVAL